jgi:DNA-binding transcriptional LysR family regulator
MTMHFKGLDLNLLLVLDVLLKERSVTRAGLHLHLSPSSVSGALGRLREYFDDELLMLVGRKMVPTPLGERIAVAVSDILLQVQATIDIKLHFNPGTVKRHFTIMMSDYVSTAVMADALRKILDIAPGLTFDLIPPTDAHSEALDRGEIDLLIMPKNLISEQHPAKMLFDDTYVCLVDGSNTDIDQHVSLEQYKKLGHVVVKAGAFRDLPHSDLFLSSQKIERRIEVTTISFNCVPRYIVGTRRIATLQKRLVDEYIKYFPLKSLAPPIDIPKLVEMIQWHKYKENDPVLMWLVNNLKQSIT